MMTNRCENLRKVARLHHVWQLAILILNVSKFRGCLRVGETSGRKLKVRLDSLPIPFSSSDGKRNQKYDSHSNMIGEIFKNLSVYFHGLNLVVVIAGLFLIWGARWWFFAIESERKKAKPVVCFSLIVLVACSAIIIFNNWREGSALTFSKSQTGVLILHIVGDKDNLLQRDLLESLRQELGKAQLTNIAVRVLDEELDDSNPDASSAHQRARRIGKQLNAQLVVWGSRVGEKKFWPFITIVNQSKSSFLHGERQLDPQEVDQMHLPLELVDEPIYLATFIVGLSSYESGHYEEALKSLESASKFPQPSSDETAPLSFFTAACRLHLAETQSDPNDTLNLAIGEFQSAASGFGKTNSPENWAMTQNRLGVALLRQAEHSEGKAVARLSDAAATAFNAALQVRTREKFPLDWAGTQINLGNALDHQAGNTEGKTAARLLAEAVAAYHEALKVFTRQQFPLNWALAQVNLGNVLNEQACNEEGEVRMEWKQPTF